MKAWLRDRLAQVIEGDRIVLERDARGETVVQVDVFAELLPVAVPSYSNLVAADKAKGCGYGRFLRAWRERGLL